MRLLPTRHSELLTALISKEFKVRYKNTLLGFLWSLANPILFALVFYFVFEKILLWRSRFADIPYLAFLLTGLFPWQWFANVINTSPTLFITNAGLIRPRSAMIRKRSIRPWR